MKHRRHLAMAVCLTACFVGAARAETIQPVFQQALPAVAGKTLTAVTVDFAPGVLVPNVPKVTARDLSYFNRLFEAVWDCRKVGGQAAIAVGGYGSLAGWNLRPKPEPSVPL